MTNALCAVDEISAEGKEVMLEHEGKRWYLALFSTGGQIVCYHNVCPHQGRNLNYAPDRFLFDPQGQLVCPHHGALFDVASGVCRQGPCGGSALRSVPVQLENGTVYLRTLDDLTN